LVAVVTGLGEGNSSGDTPGGIFVIQEHVSSRWHHDLRLEKDGVLKSWAVPKGVPLVEGVKRLVIPTEDHPLEYAEFEGVIPEGCYGAGRVKIYDKGGLLIKKWEENKIEFELNGKKVRGTYVMIKTGVGWLLFKKRG